MCKVAGFLSQHIITLPEAIFSTYTEYKSDTLRIATWLASAATRCRYTPTSTETPNNGTVMNASGADDAANRDGVGLGPQKVEV